MEKLVRQGMLFDTYGELLTERQSQIYRDVVYEDLSLSEAAATYGISRQGIHDHIKRCDHILEDYESKLHIIRDREASEALSKEALSLIDDLLESPGAPDMESKLSHLRSVVERAFGI